MKLFGLEIMTARKADELREELRTSDAVRSWLREELKTTNGALLRTQADLRTEHNLWLLSYDEIARLNKAIVEDKERHGEARRLTRASTIIDIIHDKIAEYTKDCGHRPTVLRMGDSIMDVLMRYMERGGLYPNNNPCIKGMYWQDIEVRPASYNWEISCA